ncbi:Asparagine synthetase [glutamine-hydrolyzing] 3 [Candidatus Hydrogenisulfobacillus filiaventi]|uniref:asparagine synthase (glutamine-hydrolyzing) n=1 Tax=Candidatus Hydrogenisulfobacillus filiaventi TaxID=2707344 RepID=A0A6F8ZGR4_9FIRM|nr:asparagine synthase (glutamine-hydrolyzing) [Bacillota bacterium]CAB1128897.1 Asparagine synthetase [glutamine-hydrolyzing] 3 [Candidatus Hydrogenisulfobacillus filiaventi]
MCGITGWFRPGPGPDAREEAAVLDAMVASLACRGPDGEGRYQEAPGVALGHRRLVVVDPAGGAQPMTARQGGADYALTYNGELYNYLELRRELEARGHHFRTRSDTEVVLRAYLEWQEEALPRFNGIFALAVWDGARQALFLARDRLGVKPLFYGVRQGTLVFGSEIKALLQHPAFEPVLDAQGLNEVLALGPARTPGEGVFRDIREVLPGQWVRFDRHGLTRGTYWRLEAAPYRDDPLTSTHRVRELLEDAVRLQLMADVPLATLLSGGLDSSAVTALAARHIRGRLQTFAIDFVDQDRYFRPDAFQTSLDRPWAREVAAWVNSDHHEVMVANAELVAAHDRALEARDLPGMADVDASLYLFFRAIRPQVTVALSGEGADELFGGYPWFHRPDALAAETFPWALRLADRLRLLEPGLRRQLEPEAYVAERYRQALAEVPRLPGESAPEARRREITYLSLTRFLPVLLDRKDRMSMAVGLEVRVPFLDHRLVEYVWNLPWPVRAPGQVPKGILRHAVEDLLPPAVVERRKTPYPSTHDPEYGRAWRDALAAILDDPAQPLVPLLDTAYVRGLLDRPPAAPLPWFGQLMGTAQLFAFLVQVNRWLVRYRIRLAL